MGDGITLVQLVAEYSEDLKVRGARSVKHYVFLTGLIREFGDMEANAFTAREMRRFQAWLRSRRYQPSTVNVKVRFLRSALRFAERQGYIERAPLSPRPLRERGPRQGFLSADDYRSISAYLPEWAEDIFAFAYYSGWRRNEILSLSWREVDIESQLIRLDPCRSKTGKSRICPMVGGVGKVLRRRERARIHGLGLVFHREGGRVIGMTFDRYFHEAREKAGLPKVILHDCRRTAVRNLIRAGVPERIAMQLTGHESRAVFDRYNIVVEDDLFAAARQMNNYIEAN